MLKYALVENVMAMVLVITLCACFMGCKSQAKTFQTHSETLADLKRETVQTSGNQMDYASATQSESQTNETAVQETIVIKFDTSMPKDSATGTYPVKEIKMVNLNKGIKTQLITVDVGQKTQSQSSIELGDEQVQMTEKETIKSQILPNKINIRYLLFALMVVTSFIFLYRFLHKKRR